MKVIFLSIIISVVLCTVNAQTTGFTYQGSLANGGSAATGNFDFEFLLYDALTGGTQLGSTQSRTNVVVTNGVFKVDLDFGSQFPGSNRYLEIRVRVAGGGGHTILAPRQLITSTPYAVKAVAADTAANAANATNATNSTNATNAANAAQLGGLPPSRYVQADANGNVGIGAAPAAGSKLTVGGQLQLTSGAIKFPDSTTQTTAGIASVTAAAPLTGSGTPASPLGIQTPLPIKLSEAPWRQRVHFIRRPNAPSAQFYVVPAGKYLIVDNVSGSVEMPTAGGSPYIDLEVFAPESPKFNYLPTIYLEPDANRKWWIFGSSTPAYFPPGSAAAFFLQTNGIGALSWEININGYLVDVP